MFGHFQTHVFEDFYVKYKKDTEATLSYSWKELDVFCIDEIHTPLFLLMI